MELKFTLKDAKEKQTLLYAVCYHDSKRIKVSTGLKVVSETWSAKMQRCEISSRFTERVNRASRKVNKLLDEILEKWKRTTEEGNTLWRQSKLHTREEIIKGDLAYIVSRVMKAEEEEEEKKQITPLQYFDKYVEEMCHKVDPRTGRYIGERTQVHHRTVLKRIKAFMAEKYIKDDFSVFDERFARLFTDWAYTSKNYRQNTIPATFSVLKVWLNAAKAEKLFDGEEYKKFPSKGADVDNIYLTEDEIERIYRLDIPTLIAKGEIDAKSQIEKTRDLFVIGCWTGLRRSDINRLEKALFDLEKNEVTIVTEKTGEKVTIPMHPFIKELYEKYDGKFPKLTDKANTNRHLQEIGRHAQIEEKVMIKENRGGKIDGKIYKKYQLIKMHTARRSFATNLYLKGAPTIKIMKLTGHTTETNFLKYIKITREETSEQMRDYFK
jgi:integrase